MAILCHRIPTVAQNVDLLRDFTLTSQLVKGKCEIKWDSMKLGLTLSSFLPFLTTTKSYVLGL